MNVVQATLHECCINVTAVEILSAVPGSFVACPQVAVMVPRVIHGGDSEKMIKLNAPRLSLTASVIALTAAFGAPAYAQSTSTPPINPASSAGPAERCQPAPSRPVRPTTFAPPVRWRPSRASRRLRITPPRSSSRARASSARTSNRRSRSPRSARQELTNQGQVSVGDALNDLPALRSTFSQQNSGRFIGTAGQNFLDLRGLGTNRTLVLVNGRRMITAAPGDFTVDVDNIPQDLIDRIDVVTGGEFGVLRFGRGRGRRQLRPQARFRRLRAFAARAAFRSVAIARSTSFRPPSARISPTAAATSR